MHASNAITTTSVKHLTWGNTAAPQDEMKTGFGEVMRVSVPTPGEVRMTKVQLFGDAKAVEAAVALIEEALANKEQKAKQREKEYEKKKEEKRRLRQIYHLRHAHDYEALELPLGAAKVDVKKAYRKLAMKWHPDKHPDDPEGAKAKFQEILAAHDRLMTTNEDEKIEAIGHR